MVYKFDVNIGSYINISLGNTKKKEEEVVWVKIILSRVRLYTTKSEL